jgi:hypothetical protein
MKVMCNGINSDTARASDRSNDHDYVYASDNANSNDKTRRVMLI